MTLDNALWLGGAGLELILLVMLVRRRVYRTLPVFFFYLVWCLGSDAVGMVLSRYFPAAEMPAFLVDATVYTLLQLAMLAELGASAARYSRANRPSRILLALLMAVACALIWSLAKWNVPTGPGTLPQICVVLLQVFAILRVAALLALAWWSSLQGSALGRSGN